MYSKNMEKKVQKKGTKESIGWTKGWEAKFEISGLDLEDEERLRKMYNIPSSVQIMIPKLGIFDNTPFFFQVDSLSSEGFMAQGQLFLVSIYQKILDKNSVYTKIIDA